MQGRLHLLELLHHRSRVALQAEPPLREREPVVCADKQRAAQLRFQRGDALAQRLPRQKQPLCRAGVVHFFAQDQKVVQLADIHGFLPNSFINRFRIPPFGPVVKPARAKRQL